MASSELLERTLCLSENLRFARTRAGLSQAALAQRAGIPRTTLTSLEAGGGNPTLSVLLALGKALGHSLEELLHPPRRRLEHFPAGSRPVNKKGTRVEIEKLLPHPIPGMEMDHMQLRPGARMTGVPHRAGTYEYLYVIEGTMTLFVAGERLDLGPGDMASFAGDQKHGYHNRGQGHARALSVVSLRPPSKS